jgi:hypothetical protein
MSKPKPNAPEAGEEAAKAAAAAAAKAADEKAAADKAAADEAEKAAAAMTAAAMQADDEENALNDRAAAEGLEVVTVIGPANGRRRGGHQFGSAPVVVAVTAEQLAAIEADPDLSVTQGNALAEIEDVAVSDAGAASAGRLPLEAFLDGDGEPVEIVVIGPARGKRRAGMEFGREAVTFEPDRAQLEAILNDAELSVQPA